MGRGERRKQHNCDLPVDALWGDYGAAAGPLSGMSGMDGARPAPAPGINLLRSPSRSMSCPRTISVRVIGLRAPCWAAATLWSCAPVAGVARRACRPPELAAPNPAIPPLELILVAHSGYRGESAGTKVLRSVIAPFRQTNARGTAARSNDRPTTTPLSFYPHAAACNVPGKRAQILHFTRLLSA